MKPILFSTDMVQAILEGRKTMTRRILHPKSTALDWINSGFSTEFILNEWNAAIRKYNVGDILWVRETFENYQGAYNYKAGKYGLLGEKWKPSIFMPKEAARIFLRVTDLRLERLQDISEEDAIAEGIERKYFDNVSFEDVLYYKNYKTGGWEQSILFVGRHSFQSLWESINGKNSWNGNPYVWVICFERVENGALN